MNTDVINGVPTKALSVDAAKQLHKYMEKINHHPHPDHRADAFFFLMGVKQELINMECYETLRDFKRLEDMHGVDIPFKLEAS